MTIDEMTAAGLKLITRPANQDEFLAGEVFVLKGRCRGAKASVLVVESFQNNRFIAEDGWSHGLQSESGKAHQAYCRPATDAEIQSLADAQLAKTEVTEQEKNEIGNLILTKTSQSGHRIVVQKATRGYLLTINDKICPDFCFVRKLAKPIGDITHTIGSSPAVGLTTAEAAQLA